MAAHGEARVFHTNAWRGVRRTGQAGGHWTGDTSAVAATAYLESLKLTLAEDGWDFAAPKTKLLMLSHSILAREQGYSSIPPIYGQFNDRWLKKEDPHIKFLVDHLEPACAAFLEKRYSAMFGRWGTSVPRIQRHEQKVRWSESLRNLLALRETASIGEVIDFIALQPHMALPDQVCTAESALAAIGAVPVDGESNRVTRLRNLRGVPYREIIALSAFIEGHTPFATNHGVKGAEFENVLVVVGRGWNKYNFAQMLEWLDEGPPVGRADFFESNRNLFYVACSRPKTRLAMLFTQVLSAPALAKLTALFGEANVVELPEDPVRSGVIEV